MVREPCPSRNVTQNACIKLARSKTYEREAAFLHGLSRVINTAIDMQQRAENRHDHAQSEMDECKTATTRKVPTTRAEMMQQIGKLPEKEKTALLLVVKG